MLLRLLVLLLLLLWLEHHMRHWLLVRVRVIAMARCRLRAGHTQHLFVFQGDSTVFHPQPMIMAMVMVVTTVAADVVVVVVAAMVRSGRSAWRSCRHNSWLLHFFQDRRGNVSESLKY